MEKIYNLGSLQIYNLSPFNAIQFEHSEEIVLFRFALSILHTFFIILWTSSLVVFLFSNVVFGK